MHMMNQKHVEAKLQLATAFAELAGQTPPERITINMIVDRLGKHRKTFYYHFEDIYALLRWIFEEDCASQLRSLDPIGEPVKAINFIFDYIEKNRDMLKSALDAFGSVELSRNFAANLSGIIRSLVETAEKRMERRLPDQLRDYLCEFLTEAESGMLLDYITGRFPFDRPKTLDFLMLIMRTAIVGLLNERGVPTGEAEKE